MTKVYRFQGVTFEWDEQKAERNIQKHGITFEEAEEAAEVFFDPLAVFDNEYQNSEFREIVLGCSYRFRTLMVIHVERSDRIRIISVRKATNQELRRYESNI